MLTKEQILNSAVPKVEVHIPEFGGSVYVKTMTGSERDQFEADHIKSPNQDIRGRLAAYTVCDENGKLLFSPSDVKALGNKSAAGLDRIFAIAIKLNGISKQDVEDLEANFTETQREDSCSA